MYATHYIVRQNYYIIIIIISNKIKAKNKQGLERWII